MSSRTYKLDITNFPNYLDGYFDVYKLMDDNEVYPFDECELILSAVPFSELSVTDKLRFESHQRGIELTYKLRTTEYKELTTKHLLMIDGHLHKIFNIFHFTNKEGFKETDITLEKLKTEVKINANKE